MRELLTELTKNVVLLTKLNQECKNNLIFTNTTRQAIRAKKILEIILLQKTTVNFDNYQEKKRC